MWELRSAVSADGSRGRISPGEMKEVAAKVTGGEHRPDAIWDDNSDTSQTLLNAKKVTFDTTNTLAFH